jgi:hypothetical protein
VKTGEGYLDVPGAKLYYKLQGSGPVLFTLQGGPGDADGSDGLAAGGFSADPDPEVQPERPSGEGAARHAANMQFFLKHDAPSAHHYQLDIEALRPVSERIVPAAGLLSRDMTPYRCAQSLAKLLGRTLHEFPGNHSGYVSRPRAFGEELHRVLTGS